MTTSREIKELYPISTSSIEGLVSQLNMNFRKIADRLDEIEGLRGTSPFAFSGQTHVADAITAHSSATTAELNALGSKINEILDILQTATLMEE
jgi:hypothetical protein